MVDINIECIIKNMLSTYAKQILNTINDSSIETFNVYIMHFLCAKTNFVKGNFKTTSN